jgi:hypothetical protein
MGWGIEKKPLSPIATRCRAGEWRRLRVVVEGSHPLAAGLPPPLVCDLPGN